MSLDEFEKKVVVGFNLAIKRMIEQAKKDDREIVISQNGKVVHIKARDLK